MKNSRLKTAILLVLLFATSAPAFAQGIVPQGMTTLAVLTGGLVRTILVIFLAACAVAYGFRAYP